MGYTFDYDNFVSNQYMYHGTVDELSSIMTIKANRIGTLYIHF